MDFSEHIITYYNAESRHSFVNGMATGIVMLLVAILFWSFSDTLSLKKGLAVVLFFGGVLASSGGYFSGSSARKGLPEKIQLYQHDKRQFFEKEWAKVEAIHKAWTRIKLFWTAFIVLGLVLIFIPVNPFWTGIAIGSLILGTIGHIEEIQSMKHNEWYYNQVLKERTS